MTSSKTILIAAVAITAFISLLFLMPEPADGTDEPGTDATLIRGARVFDGERDLGVTDVLVRDGRIHRVQDGIDATDDVTVIDATGRTLLPGLIDAHVHSWGEARADALRFGTTTVLDQFTEHSQLGPAKEARSSIGDADRADLFSAGTLVTAPGGHGSQFGIEIPTVDDHTDIPAFVSDRLAEGSDWIKIVYDDGHVYGLDFPTLSYDQLEAVMAAAHAQGVLAVVHVGDLESTEEAFRAGAGGLVHAWGDAVLSEELATEMAGRDFFVSPTLAIIESMAGGHWEPDLTGLEDRLSPAQKRSLGSPFPGEAGERRTRLDRALENVRRMHEAGVTILAGTDAPNPGTAFGISMYRELELLVHAGLTEVEALAAATSVPARAYGITDRGHVAEGQLADLVLVDGDPLTDITEIRGIVTVFKDGVRHDTTAWTSAPGDRGAGPAAPRPEGTLLADFADGIGSAFGYGWQTTTDRMAGGSSTAEMSHSDEGAASPGSLTVTGTVETDFAYPWAGAMVFLGAQPMMPVDLSDRQALRFRVRGDGREYRVMVFSGEGTNGAPPMQSFHTGDDWTDVRLPLAGFAGAELDAVTGIAFVAGRPAGDFRFQLDDVEIR